MTPRHFSWSKKNQSLCLFTLAVLDPLSAKLEHGKERNERQYMCNKYTTAAGAGVLFGFKHLRRFA
jgi:hypothetical protein